MDQYPDVRIEWIRHHNPELDIFENGRKVQTIDLSPYTTTKLHDLFSKHFTRTGTHGRSLGETTNVTGQASSSATSIISTSPSTSTIVSGSTSAGTNNSSVALSAAPPLRPNDTVLPLPHRRQAVDAMIAAAAARPSAAPPTATASGVNEVPTYALLAASSGLVLALLSRCVVQRRHRAPKAAAMEV